MKIKSFREKVAYFFDLPVMYFYHCRANFRFFFIHPKVFRIGIAYIEKQVYEKTSIIILLYKTKTNEQMGQILIG